MRQGGIFVDSIQRIKKYISSEKKALNINYEMSINECLDLMKYSRKDTGKALCLAFDYGRAKGYRTAKSETQVISQKTTLTKSKTAAGPGLD